MPPPLADEPTSPAAPERRSVDRWRQIVPPALAVLLVAYVVVRLDLRALFRALAGINFVGYLAFACGFLLILLAADSFATAYVYRKTVAPVRFSELFVIRGASYLPSMLNHHVGQGWLTYFVSRAYHVALWRVAGATLLVYVTTFGGLFVLGLVALPFNFARLPWLSPTVFGLALAAAAYVTLIWLRPTILQRRQATAPLIEVGVRGHLTALGYRMPHIIVQFAGTWLPFWFFDIQVPFVDALAVIPLIMLVQALPITPQGVGTRDVLALELLARYAPGGAEQGSASIAAATLSWAGALTLVQLAISPILMRRARALLYGSRP